MEDFRDYQISMRSVTQMTVNLDPNRHQRQGRSRRELALLRRKGMPQDTRETIVRDVGVELRLSGKKSRIIQEYLEELRRAEMESIMEVEAKSISATKSSIEALERMVFDDLENPRECTICIEEIEAGMEAIRMPCSHFYHPDCIVTFVRFIAMKCP
ncbi:zinc finger protein, putative [Ricinus communis]|uniref:RING-type E3 ubiquitin transferase n=1 Tax=Ricinus communis TaxID=3988 RepID=B9R955_RICCO|nr:zinc finger protein, putative [Ricinus communis]